MVTEQGEIHRLQALEVEIAIGVAGRPVAVDEIIVEFHDFGPKPQHAALLGNPERRGGLAAGGRSGDKDNLNLLPSAFNGVRDLGIAPLLAGLFGIDNLNGPAVVNRLVQTADPVDPGDPAPVGILLERGTEARLLLDRNDLRNIRLGRRLEAESHPHLHEAEHGQATGREHERTVEGIRHFAQIINAAEIPAEGLLQFNLERLAVLAENIQRIVQMNLLTREGLVLRNDGPHPLQKDINILLHRGIGNGHAVLVPLLLHNFTVQTARKGVLHHQHLAREKFPDRFLQDELQGTDIGAPPVVVVVADESHFMRPENRGIKPLEFVVDQRGQDGIFRPGLGIADNPADHPGHLPQRSAVGDFIVLAVVGEVYGNLFHSYLISRSEMAKPPPRAMRNEISVEESTTWRVIE